MYYLLIDVTSDYSSYAVISDTSIGYFKANLTKAINSFNTRSKMDIKSSTHLQEYLDIYDHMPLPSANLVDIQYTYPELFI